MGQELEVRCSVCGERLGTVLLLDQMPQGRAFAALVDRVFARERGRHCELGRAVPLVLAESATEERDAG